MVSHDRSFLDRICSHIIAFEKSTDKEQGNSVIYVHTGNYTDYQNYKKNQTSKPKIKDVIIKEEKPKEKTRQKRSYKEEQEYQKIPSIIEALELEKSTIEDEMSQKQTFKKDPKIIQEKLERLKTLNDDIEKLYNRWQELSDISL